MSTWEGPWVIGWEAVAAVATALAAVTALIIWLMDRRRAQQETASLLTLDVQQSSQLAYEDFTAEESQRAVDLLTSAGFTVPDPDHPLAGIDINADLRVATELSEEFSAYSSRSDGSLQWVRISDQVISVVIDNQSPQSAYRITVSGRGGQGRRYIPVLHPGVKVTFEGDGEDLTWGDHASLDFDMAGRRWSYRFGRPAKRVRFARTRRRVYRLHRSMYRFVMQRKVPVTRVTTSSGTSFDFIGPTQRVSSKRR